MKKIYKRLIGSVVVFFMTVSMISPAFVFAAYQGYGTECWEHSGVAYSDMAFTGYDAERIYSIVADMESKMSDVKNSRDIIEDYDKLLREFDIYATQSVLNQIMYYRDVTVPECAESYLELSALGPDISDKSMRALRAVLNSPCADALKEHIDDPYVVNNILESVDLTDREKELKQLNDELVQQYDSSSQVEYTTVFKGVEWNAGDVYYAYANGELSDDDYIYLRTQIAKEKNAVQADIYVQMVNERNELARIRGYENYAEYSYENEYNRDYSTDDARVFYEYVKKYIVPLEERVFPYYSTLFLSAYDKLASGFNMEDEELVKRVEPAIAKIHPDLMEAYRYLEDTHTYDMDYLDTKMGIGYTVAVYQYGCPFIFSCSDGAYSDLKTVIHEFGHYNNLFHTARGVFLDEVNMDVAEIHSQGLEVLALKYAEEIFGKDCADAVRMIILYGLLDAVISGCLYDEFQNAVYAYDGELTVSECNRIFKNISVQYGYGYAEGTEEAYSWIDVTHTFQSPMYYISYATSAIEALNIFAIAQEDREKAVDLYMEISAYPISTQLCELTELVGLPSIFEEKTIAEIGEQVENYAEKLYTDFYRKARKKEIIITAVIVIAGAVLVTLTVIIILKTVEKRRAKAQEFIDMQASEDIRALVYTQALSEEASNDAGTEAQDEQ